MGQDRTDEILALEADLRAERERTAEARRQQAAALAHAEQAEQIMDGLRQQLAAAAAQVRGLTAERNDLINQRNDATVRAIKAENPAAAGARFVDDGAAPALPWLRPQVDLIRYPLPALQTEPVDFIDAIHAKVAAAFTVPAHMLHRKPASDLPDSEGGTCD